MTQLVQSPYWVFVYSYFLNDEFSLILNVINYLGFGELRGQIRQTGKKSTRFFTHIGRRFFIHLRQS